MFNLDGWDYALMAMAGYIAVVSLVRMMRARHDDLLADLQRQAEQEQERKRKAERQAKKSK